jgi:hypothetical protein
VKDAHLYFVYNAATDMPDYLVRSFCGHVEVPLHQARALGVSRTVDAPCNVGDSADCIECERIAQLERKVFAKPPRKSARQLEVTLVQLMRYRGYPDGAQMQFRAGDAAAVSLVLVNGEGQPVYSYQDGGS